MSQYLENNMTENSSNITQVELGKKTAIGTGASQSAFLGDRGMDNEIDRITLDTVSYTHLTLPTICSV